MRIAQLEGMHTALPEDELSSDIVIRCRNLWWNLYNLDRYISTSLGLPMSVSDNDVRTLVNTPHMNARENTTLGLQVKLSHLLEVISSSKSKCGIYHSSRHRRLTPIAIYKNEKTQLVVFLESTRSILHTMAGHAQEFENIIQTNLPSLVETETMPRGTRLVTLLYHQVCDMLLYTHEVFVYS